jgi:hypothetical protein
MGHAARGRLPAAGAVVTAVNVALGVVNGGTLAGPTRVQLTLRDAPGAGSITIAGVAEGAVTAHNVTLTSRTSTASPSATLDGGAFASGADDSPRRCAARPSRSSPHG